MIRSYSTAAPSVPQAAKRGYGFVASILDGINDEELIDTLQRARMNGRPGYPCRSMWRAWLCKYILSIRYNVDLIERLNRSPRFRRICGFDDVVPSESTFSRFFSSLTNYQDLVEDILENITDKLSQMLPNFGKIVAADATVFETYGNPNRKTVKGDPCGDMDARWGYKNSARTKDKENIEWCFGYKMHAIADAIYGLPLGFILTPANASENPLLRDVIRAAQKSHRWLKPRILIADKGYDSDQNHRFLLNRNIAPIIHLVRQRTNADSPLHKGLYTDKGQPTCVGNLPMEYVKTDRHTGQHLFRCQQGGCPLQNRHGVRYCDYKIWEDPAKEPRIVGAIARASPLWKKMYKLRWSIERLFGSAKRNRNLDQHCFRGIRKNLLHATLSILTYSATALAHLDIGDRKRMRVMRMTTR